MNTMNFIIWQVLSCGSLDVDFIDRLEEEFKIEFDWDNLRDRIINEHLDANGIIYEIFYNALNETCEELDLDFYEIMEKEGNYDIFCNCLDSHLYVKNKEGNFEEIWDKDQLVEFLQENYLEEEN